MITIALPKGALLKDSIELFRNLGLDFSAFLDKTNRQLQITDPTNVARALLVRAQDVPVYVEYGQAQLGIVGYDVLREKQSEVANLVDLQFGYCRLSVAVPQSSPYRRSLELPPHGRVASKFVNCAKEYFDSIDLPIEIVPDLPGCRPGENLSSPPPTGSPFWDRSFRHPWQHLSGHIPGHRP